MIKNMVNSISDNKSPVFIITGEQGEGKTTLLLKIIAYLKDQGVRMQGIAAPGFFQDGIRSGFDILDIESGESAELCSVIPAENCEQFGRFFFRKSGLAFGKNILAQPFLPGQVDLLVIDEVGRFEINGNVWCQSIDLIMNRQHPPMIWTVRKPFLDAVTAKWPVKRLIIIKSRHENYDEIIFEIMDEIEKFRTSLIEYI